MNFMVCILSQQQTSVLACPYKKGIFNHLKALLYIIYTSMNSVELPPIWMWVAFTKNKSAKSKVAYSKYPMPVFSEYTLVLLSSLTRVKWPLNKHLKVYLTSEMPVKNIM